MGQHLDPKVGSQVASFYANVKSIKATGTHEITIKMKSPDSAFQYVPAGPRRADRAEGLRARSRARTSARRATLDDGDGPLQDHQVHARRGRLARPQRRLLGPEAGDRRFEIKFITAQATRLLAMRSGQIDGAFEVPVDQADQWARISTARVLFAPQLSVYFFSMDTEAEPWSDIHVRRAVAYAADKAGMLKTQFSGHGEVATSLVPPGQWGGVLAQAAVKKLYASFPAYSFNIDKAKKELAASTVPDGFSATLVFPDSVPAARQDVPDPGGEPQAAEHQADCQAGQCRQVAERHVRPQEPRHPVRSRSSPTTPIRSTTRSSCSAASTRSRTTSTSRTTRTPRRQAAGEAGAGDESSVRAKAIGQMLKIAADDEPYLPLDLAGHGRRGLEEVRLHRLQRALLQPALGDEDPPRVAA